MTPEQTERLFSTLGRIEQKIESHVVNDEKVHNTQSGDIKSLYSKVNGVEKTQARHRGIALGFTGVIGTILGLLKYNGG